MRLAIRSLNVRTLVLIAAATAANFAPAALAAVVVAPNAQANALGNGQDNDTRFFGRTGDTDGQRYQQVYGASQFTALGATENITAIAFRAKVGGFFFPNIFGRNITVSNIIVKLAYTPKASSIDGPNFVSPDLASNIGAGLKTVYSGTLSVSTPTAGDTSFGYVINLQSPFAYTKANGNLILDVTIPAGATTTESGSSGYSRPDTQTGDALGANADDGIASAFADSASATIGGDSTTGLVTQFTTVVPEPTTLAAIAGLGAIAARRRRA